MREAGMQRNVPKLRFPEFSGKWYLTRLGQFFEEHREKSTTQDQHEVLTSARAGLIRQRDYYDNERITDRDNIGFNVIPPNFLTYRSRSDDRKFFFNENILEITGIISIYYPVFRIVGGNNRFFSEMFSRYVNYIGKYSVGTSQTVLSLNELKRIKLPIPTLPEQQKIADSLEAVDARVALLRRRHEALAAYKKAMMQRLFACTLRFTKPDGSPFPDWQEKRLGELGEFCGGGTPDTNHAENWAGDIPWISSSDISEDSIRDISITRNITREALTSSATKIVPPNSILIVSRVGVGKLAVSTTELCTSQDFCNFTPFADSAIFLAYWMAQNQNILLRLCQGTSIKGLTTVDLKGMKIPLPHPEEQQKIANFLTALDAKIDAAAAQIDAMQRFKQGLLQQMFV